MEGEEGLLDDGGVQLVRSTTRERWPRRSRTWETTIVKSVWTSSASTLARALTKEGRTSSGADAADVGADGGVVGEQVDPVAGAGGEPAEQQRGLHRSVQAGAVADPARADAAGVEHDQPRAGRVPGARCAPARRWRGRWRASRWSARRRRPRIRGRSRIRCPGRGSACVAAVELPQPGHPAQQALAAERRQRAHRPRHLRRVCRPAKPRGPIMRTVTGPACRSPRRVGASRVVSRQRSPPGRSSRLPAVPRPGRGRPVVPHRAAHRPAPGSPTSTTPAPCRAGPWCRRPGRAAACRAAPASSEVDQADQPQHQQHQPSPPHDGIDHADEQRSPRRQRRQPAR